MGSSHLRETDSNRRTITAVTSFLHPDFDGESLQNDIGLIQLPSDLQLNGTCFKKAKNQRTLLFDKTNSC